MRSNQVPNCLLILGLVLGLAGCIAPDTTERPNANANTSSVAKATPSPSPKSSELSKNTPEREPERESTAQPNEVPNDSRIVVNIPAYRMDVFRNGALIQSYKVGIGYPEFPLPVGLREAKEIIFNPTWTAPDEPWVEASRSIKVGETIPAGSKLNPLGQIKIPIGLPSLIHGGKSPAQLGGFASHGCVGLTNPQIHAFVITLGQITGLELSESDINAYTRNKTETKTVSLKQAVPIELRYETIAAEDGKLRIFRDVYGRGTNTEENLKRVLQAYRLTIEDLSTQERAGVTAALKEMARDASGNPVTAGSEATRHQANSNQSARVTRVIKGSKEKSIEIAALEGKGYPLAVNLNMGGRISNSQR